MPKIRLKISLDLILISFSVGYSKYFPVSMLLSLRRASDVIAYSVSFIRRRLPVSRAPSLNENLLVAASSRNVGRFNCYTGVNSAFFPAHSGFGPCSREREREKNIVAEMPMQRQPSEVDGLLQLWPRCELRGIPPPSPPLLLRSSTLSEKFPMLRANIWRKTASFLQPAWPPRDLFTFDQPRDQRPDINEKYRNFLRFYNRETVLRKEEKKYTLRFENTIR